MTPAMKVRLLIVCCLMAPLAGCVSLGATDLLVTPVGIVGVHSFAPSTSPTQDTDTVRPQPSLTADAAR